MNAWKFAEMKTAVGQMPARAAGWLGLSLVLTALTAGCNSAGNSSTSAPASGGTTVPAASGGGPADQLVAAIPFNERNGDEDYNASGVVALAEGRFLFCDNNTGDALFELQLSPQGQQEGPVIRRPLLGLAPGAVDDLEGLTLAEAEGRRYLFATSSLYLKKARKNKPDKLTPSGLLRVLVNADGSLQGENMPGFRAWLLQQVPELAAAAELEPDDGGLNIEGLAWDPQRQALLFGVRTPSPGGQPLVLPVKVKDLGGAWATSNLTLLEPIRLALPATAGPLGIRSLEYVAERKAFLVLAGKSISDSNAPFAVYEWDGQTPSGLKRLPFAFARKVKPEGLASGTLGGKPVLLFVDDGGGFQTHPLDVM
jgi:hypothetical protein